MFISVYGTQKYDGSHVDVSRNDMMILLRWIEGNKQLWEVYLGYLWIWEILDMSVYLLLIDQSARCWRNFWLVFVTQSFWIFVMVDLWKFSLLAHLVKVHPPFFWLIVSALQGWFFKHFFGFKDEFKIESHNDVTPKTGSMELRAGMVFC